MHSPTRLIQIGITFLFLSVTGCRPFFFGVDTSIPDNITSKGVHARQALQKGKYDECMLLSGDAIAIFESLPKSDYVSRGRVVPILSTYTECAYYERSWEMCRKGADLLIELEKSYGTILNPEIRHFLYHSLLELGQEERARAVKSEIDYMESHDGQLP